MKSIKLYGAVVAMCFGMFACDTIEDREGLGPELDPADVKYSITQQSGYDNKVFLTNETVGAMPYWDYVIGTSKRAKDTVTYPFLGDYWIKFTAFGKAGASKVDSTKITVTANDPAYFADPIWAKLTNGSAGKTWLLDIAAPIGWAGLDYGKASGDNWNWFPSYNDATWSMEAKDWGEMTFDLNGSYNHSVTQTDLNTATKTTTKGSFSLDIANKRIKFFGTQLLIGGDYRGDVSNWRDVKILELTETSMQLAVIRDQSRSGEGVCLIMFHFVPKP